MEYQMKNKGLLIALAVIGVIAVIVAVLFLGFLWGRGWFGRGCCRSWGRGNTFPGYGKSMMWEGDRGWSSRNGSLWSESNGGGNVLSIKEAEEALNSYIADYNAIEELHLSEIMIFDNHAYAIVKEEDTGIGAFELLVDPETLVVFPEMGPNMMWNLKYSHMRGGMMSGGLNSSTEKMPISEEEALEIANEYLSRNGSGLIAEGHPDRFYGYYTIHTEKDGEIVGMLSVNGLDGEVFLHTWHGEFIEMTEHDDEH
jgi:hypothetical protein